MSLRLVIFLTFSFSVLKPNFSKGKLEVMLSLGWGFDNMKYDKDWLYDSRLDIAIIYDLL